MAQQHPDGARVRHLARGSEHTLVRRMPANTATGREDEEVEPVYELDDGSLAPHGALELLEREAEEASESPAEEASESAEE